MLALSRGIGERIVIGSDIAITLDAIELQRQRIRVTVEIGEHRSALTLARNDRFAFAPDVAVTVGRIKGSSVRFAVAAPSTMAIGRDVSPEIVRAEQRLAEIVRRRQA